MDKFIDQEHVYSSQLKTSSDKKALQLFWSDLYFDKTLAVEN